MKYKCMIADHKFGVIDELNVSDLCRTVGISRTHFYNICHNKTSPTIDVAMSITDYIREHIIEGGFITIDYLWRKGYYLDN